MLCCVGCVLLALSCVARRSRFRPHASLHPIRPRVRGTSLLLCTLHSHASHCNVRPPAFATVHASPQLTHLWRRPVAALVASPSHASSAWSPLAPWSAPRPPPFPSLLFLYPTPQPTFDPNSRPAAPSCLVWREGPHALFSQWMAFGTRRPREDPTHQGNQQINHIPTSPPPTQPPQLVGTTTRKQGHPCLRLQPIPFNSAQACTLGRCL